MEVIAGIRLIGPVEQQGQLLQVGDRAHAYLENIASQRMPAKSAFRASSDVSNRTMPGGQNHQVLGIKGDAVRRTTRASGCRSNWALARKRFVSNYS